MHNDWDRVPEQPGVPDFDNLLAVLRREKPQRPTLFEFFLNARLYRRLTRSRFENSAAAWAWMRESMAAFHAAGYDYAPLLLPGCHFPTGQAEQKASRSLNEGALIRDRASFEAYPWPDPDRFDYSPLDILAADLPAGMKFIVYGPGGVLENVIAIAGFESLCYLIADDRPLAEDVFEHVGARLVRYYRKCLEHKSVGAVIGNDDWGFKTQTMLPVEDLRHFVFPWHKEIVRAAHATGRPAILHSCGCLDAVMEDIIEDLRYDAKHSYEDAILPVEQAYERFGSRIAVLGGIDVDFVCRSAPEDIYARAAAMLERSAARGGYALGTGNSVPEYVPDAHYFALIRAALERR